MKRGSLVIYDLTGKIWYNSGDASGADITPHIKPAGLPCIVTKYGELDGKVLLYVNTDVKPNRLVTKEIKKEPGYVELQQKLLKAEGVI